MIVMEALYREFRVALPWELLYADDLGVIAETDRDADAAVETRIQIGWNKFRQLVSLLTNKVYH